MCNFDPGNRAINEMSCTNFQIVHNTSLAVSSKYHGAMWS